MIAKLSNVADEDITMDLVSDKWNEAIRWVGLTCNVCIRRE